MPKNQHFKEVISLIKLKDGYTQKQIADLVGCSAVYLSDVLSGRVPFSDRLQEKFVELFPYAMENIGIISIADGNAKVTNTNHKSVAEYEFLKKENESLKKQIEDKNELVRTLREHIELLKTIKTNNQ